MTPGDAWRWDPEKRDPSSEIVEIEKSLVPRARILDVGCGAMGGNAIYLSKKGHQVDAFDRSEEAIRVVCQRASEEEVEIRAWVADIIDLSLSPTYDLVICRGVLHFLTPGDVGLAVSNLKQATAPMGVNAISVFDDRSPIPRDLRELVLAPISAVQLRRWYGDWIVNRCEGYFLEDEHPGGIHHRHSILRFLARKPNAWLN